MLLNLWWLFVTTMWISAEKRVLVRSADKADKALHIHEVSPLVQKFTKTFLDTLDAVSPVEVVFGPSVHSNSMASVMFDVVNNNGEHIGVAHPEDCAREVEEAFQEVYHKLTPTTLIRIVGQCVGEFLYSENALKEEIVETMAKDYAQETLKALSNSPATNLHALGNGVRAFMEPTGLFTPDKWDLMKSYFVKAIYSVSKTEL